MLVAIERVAPEAAFELHRLNETVKVMHSFVHGGVHLVVHALRGYPAENLVAVLQSRKLMLCNVAFSKLLDSLGAHSPFDISQSVDAGSTSRSTGSTLCILNLVPANFSESRGSIRP